MFWKHDGVSKHFNCVLLLKLVDYLHVQADKLWYNYMYYVKAEELSSINWKLSQSSR